jgi:mono/diheme cytochrome c family protein
MYPFMRVAIGVVVTCFAVVLVQNLSGFFVSPQDGPEFKTAVAAADGGAAGEGGAANQAGAKVFSSNCASCHQPNGKGIPGVYPSLAGSAFAQGDPAIPVRIVLHGFKGQIVRNGTTFNGVMTPFQSALSDQEIADVLTFVRSSFGNSAEAIDVATVTEIRAQTAGHAGPFTEPELQQAAAM